MSSAVAKVSTPTPTRASTPAPKAEAAKPAKYLFILNDITAFRDRFIFLNSQSIVLKGAANPGGALAIMAKEVPDVTFISWDLKGVNVRKLYEILSKMHGFPCVVVAENNSPLRVSALLNSGLPHFLLPPVSGPALLQKGKFMMSALDHFAENFQPIGAEEIPKDGHWEAYGQKAATAWRMKVNGHEYFTQSDSKPHYDSKSKAWKSLDTGKVFKLVPTVEEPKYNLAQKNMDHSMGLLTEVSMEKVLHRMSGNALTSDSALTESKTVKGVESRAIPAQTSVSVKSKNPDSKMAKDMEVAVELAVERTSEITKPLEKVSKTTFTMVQTGSFKGYLLGANGSNEPDKVLTAKVRENLARILASRGEDVDSDISIKTFELDEAPFQVWAEQNAEFIINSQHGNDDVAFAYFKSTTLMEKPDGESDVFSFDLEKGLVADQQIPFDLYLHLPKNKKFVQYLKANSLLTAAMKAKLLGQGILKGFVHFDQQRDFEVYCSKNEINQSIADFKAKS